MTLESQLVLPTGSNSVWTSRQGPAPTAWDVLVCLVEPSRKQIPRFPNMDIYTLPTAQALEESSQQNDPATRYDAQSAKHYFILEGASPRRDKLRVGDILTTEKSPPIVSSTAVEEFLPSDFAITHATSSVTIRNEFSRWKEQVAAVTPLSNWNYVIRYEWARERIAQYMTAALKLEQVNAHLVNRAEPLFIVMGILQGSIASDMSRVEYSRNERVIGYRLLKVRVGLVPAVVAPTPNPESTSSPGSPGEEKKYVQKRTRNRRQLILEDVEAPQATGVIMEQEQAPTVNATPLVNKKITAADLDRSSHEMTSSLLPSRAPKSNPLRRSPLKRLWKKIRR